MLKYNTLFFLNHKLILNFIFEFWYVGHLGFEQIQCILINNYMHIYVLLTITFDLRGHMAILTQDLTTLYFHPTDLAAILNFCSLRKMPKWDFSGLFFCGSVDLKEMHGGKKNSIAIFPNLSVRLTGVRCYGTFV